MNVLASATFDGENHLLTNQSQLEFAAVDVRTRASSSATGTKTRSSTSPPSPQPYSPSCREALQGKEGDVVLLFPALPYEGVELLQEEVP